MKQIKETNKKTTILLEEGEILEIVVLKRKQHKLVVKYHNGVLFIDEIPIQEIEQLQEEKKAIWAMQEYLDKNEVE